MKKSQRYLANALSCQRISRIADDPVQASQYRDMAAAWLALAEEAKALERAQAGQTARETAQR